MFVFNVSQDGFVVCDERVIVPVLDFQRGFDELLAESSVITFSSTCIHLLMSIIAEQL